MSPLRFLRKRDKLLLVLDSGELSRNILASILRAVKDLRDVSLHCLIIKHGEADEDLPKILELIERAERILGSSIESSTIDFTPSMRELCDRIASVARSLKAVAILVPETRVSLYEGLRRLCDIPVETVPVARDFVDLRVEDVMVRRVFTVSTDDSVEDVARILTERGIGSVIVLEGENPVGIITERDLVTRVLARGLDPKRTRAGEVMSSPLISVDPEENLTRAMELFKKYRIKRLPVISQGKLVGILTITDLMRISPDLLRELSETLLSIEAITESIEEE